MGTRSLTKVIRKFDESKVVYEDGEQTVLTTMYRQYDGYPEGHGLDLAKWLSSFVIVNGIQVDEKSKVAYGADCLAAQMFAHFKDGPGGIYLMHPDEVDCGEEYIYYIHVTNSQTIVLQVFDVYENKVIFKGEPQNFVELYA